MPEFPQYYRWIGNCLANKYCGILQERQSFITPSLPISNIGIAFLKTILYISVMDRNRNQYLSKNTNSFNVSRTYNQINAHVVVHPTITTGERLQILTWLSPLEPWKRHHDVATNRFAGIGEWFLKATKFQAWRSKRDNDLVDPALFCYGAPGAGKTFIWY